MSASSNVAASALRCGPLAVAAIDAFMKEPYPAAQPLFGLPNTILNPHIFGVFNDDVDRIYPSLIEHLRRRAGRPSAAERVSRTMDDKGVTRPRRHARVRAAEVALEQVNDVKD
jgi:phosphoglycerate dehydrogenase-like enzyme